MPPKTAPASKKRPLQSGDPNVPSPAPQAKKAKTGANAASAGSSTVPATQVIPDYPLRIPKGPSGECFLPQLLPGKCHKIMDKIPIPMSWILGLDANPKNDITLGDRMWWEEHGEWIEANQKALKLTPTDMKRRMATMTQTVAPKPDEGKGDWDFICYRVPDFGRPEDEDEDEDEDDDEDNEDATEAGAGAAQDGDAQDSSKPNKPRMMSLASLYPEHKWIVSCLGKDRAQWWIQEALKRDQDSFELHFYSNYSVYGKHEVVDNVFRQFDKVAGKKKDGGASYREYWAEIEGFAYALSFILGEFVMSDDGDKCADTVELIGFMTIHALNQIKEQGAFGPDSDIQNLGTILAMLIYWVASTGCFESHMAWAHHIMKMADEAGVTLGGPTKFSEAKEELLKEPPSASDLEECKSFSWKSKVNAYMKGHKTYIAEGIPAPQGDFFDLTTMTAAERKKAAQPSGGFW